MSECPHHKKNRQKHDFAIISIVPLMLTIFILMRVWRGVGGGGRFGQCNNLYGGAYFKI